GQEIDDVLGAPVELGVALLPAEALHLRDGQPLHSRPRESVLHLVELEGLDDRLDLLHRSTSSPAPPCTMPAAGATAFCNVGATGTPAPRLETRATRVTAAYSVRTPSPRVARIAGRVTGRKAADVRSLALVLDQQAQQPAVPRLVGRIE